ncbi:hypothetical protein TNCV_1658171 [Trichonephila clavipes]|nr:hypothetical protein TNCV_1658171 [Trichonephila clavipes]
MNRQNDMRMVNRESNGFRSRGWGIIIIIVFRQQALERLKLLWSPYASQVVLCNKKNGLFPDSPEAYRFVIDYRKLNTITKYFPHCKTATAASDVVQSGRPIFDDFFQHLWPYIGNNTVNVVFQMVKRLWLIRIDQ